MRGARSDAEHIQSQLLRPMLELDYITVKGFKSIASIEELELGLITVLIGPNGSGKSNFIEVFSFLNALREGRLREYVIKAGGADNVLHFGSRNTETLMIHVSFREERNMYRIELGYTEADDLVPLGETVYFWNKRLYPDEPYSGPLISIDREAGISRRPARGIQRYVAGYLDSCRVYHFHDTSPQSPMKKVGDVNDNRNLRADGSNLAAFLYLLREMHTDSYKLIVQTVRQAAPFFMDFDLEPERLNPDKIRLVWAHAGTDAYFDVSSLSDGTLRFIALTTLFLQPKQYRPSVIIIDEPELGLHPYAITLLASLIRQVSADTQVIVATQSSLLLDHFDPEDVMVSDRINGSAQFTRLSSAELESWLEDYSLGQLWEKNELGGRPRRE